VLETAAQRFGWSSAKSEPTRGFGMACGVEKGGYVATFAEIAINPQTKEIKCIRAVTAFDCGAILNPEQCENQVQGSVIMGLGGALFEAIDFAGGKILNGKLSLYRVPRYPDLPKIETILIDRKDQPSAGAGEAAIVGIAPAIGNAVFAATGVRLRSLPLKLA
jgi:isoquinoline 1-oxidoreductase